MIRPLATLFVLMIATAGFAQEFERSSGGQIDAMVKRPSTLSGSLGLSVGSGRGYQGTFGGTVIKDRLWFFGSAALDRPISPSLVIPKAALGRVAAQITDRQSLSGNVALPSSFLSLHYTGIVSSNMFFTASVSRHSTHPE